MAPGAPVTIAAGATVHVNDGTGLALIGAINAQGTLFDGAVDYFTDLVLGGPTVTLGGAAGVVLSDNGGNRIYGLNSADQTLINNTTIAGAGQIGTNNGNNPLALQNNGTIDATGTNALVIQTGGPALVNAGLLEAKGSGGLTITNNTVVANTGTVLAASGNVLLSSNAAIEGGVLASTGGTINTSNATLDGSAAALTIAAGAMVHVNDSTTLTLLGRINTSGVIADGAYNYFTDVVVGSPTVTLAGAGGVVLSDNGGNRIFGASAADDALVNDATISGAGQIGINGGNNPLALTNNGTIDATGANALTIQTGGPAVTNAGLIEATGAGGLSVNATVISNTGTVAAIDSTVSFASNADATNDAPAAR